MYQHWTDLDILFPSQLPWFLSCILVSCPLLISWDSGQNLGLRSYKKYTCTSPTVLPLISGSAYLALGMRWKHKWFLTPKVAELPMHETFTFWSPRAQEQKKERESGKEKESEGGRGCTYCFKPSGKASRGCKKYFQWNLKEVSGTLCVYSCFTFSILQKYLF